MTEDNLPEILATLPSRISDVLNVWAQKLPDHPALVEDTGVWNYGQLASAVAEAQTWLRDSGVRPGDRVMIVGENCRTFVVFLLASAAEDALPALVNARLSAREVDGIRDHCGARLVVYTTTASSFAAEHAIRHGARAEDIPGVGLIAAGELNQDTKPEELDRDVRERVAAMIYTSGTTGLPKGVMLTHKNLLFVAAVASRIRSLTTSDRVYGVLPMSHVVGLSVVLLGSLLSGATLYLSSRFDPMKARLTLERDRITVMLGAPAMFALFLEYAKLKRITSLKFPALRIISSSGAPLHLPLKTAVENLFGMVLHNGYGVTECSPNIAQTRIESPRTDTSVGPIFPGVEVKLVDADGNTLPEGEVGELWVRGPNVMKGYYRAPEETTAAIDSEGWFNTRDLARVEDGNLFLMGRTKELIIHLGLNVYPAEVESVLNSHHDVVRSAVTGRASAESIGGEDIVAIVQPIAGSSITVRDLAEYCAQHLAPYKRPSQIVLVAEMPQTPTGKITKDAVKKIADSALQPHQHERLAVVNA